MLHSGSSRVHCIQTLKFKHLQLARKLSFIACVNASRKIALTKIRPGQRGRAPLARVLISKIFDYSEANVTLLLVGGETNITIWDLSNALHNANYLFPVYGVLEIGSPTLCFLTLPGKSKGKRFVSGNRDGTVRIWKFTDNSPHYRAISDSAHLDEQIPINVTASWSNRTTMATTTTSLSTSSSSSSTMASTASKTSVVSIGGVNNLCRVGNRLASSSSGSRFASSSGGGQGLINIWSYKTITVKPKAPSILSETSEIKTDSAHSNRDTATTTATTVAAALLSASPFSSSSSLSLTSHKTKADTTHSDHVTTTPATTTPATTTPATVGSNVFGQTITEVMSLVKTLRGHTSGVTCMLCFKSVTSGIDFIVSGALGHDICIFDSDSGTCVARFFGHRGPIIKLCMANDTTLASLSTGSDRRIRFWSMEDNYMAAIGRPVSATTEEHAGDLRHPYALKDGFALMCAAPTNSSGLPGLRNNQLFVGDGDGFVVELKWGVSSDGAGTHKSRRHLPVDSRWNVGLFLLSTRQDHQPVSSILPIFDIQNKYCGMLLGSSEGHVTSTNHVERQNQFYKYQKKKPHRGPVIGITHIMGSVFAAGSLDGTTSLIRINGDGSMCTSLLRNLFLRIPLKTRSKETNCEVITRCNLFLQRMRQSKERSKHADE